MGKYSVPEEIRKFKPRGKMVKCISGKYYVYDYKNQKDENGRWHIVMGSCIGQITPALGFVPNRTFSYAEENTTLEYGQYAIVYENSKGVLEKLQMHFNNVEAHQIYLMSVIHVVNGYTSITAVPDMYEMSYFPLLFPQLKMSYHVLSRLLSALGQKQTRVHAFEQMMLDGSSGEVAIDGHVIASPSRKNALSEFGNKYQKLGESQVNLVMVYDINHNCPLTARFFEGGKLDKTSIKDMFKLNDYKNLLLIIDKGFHSDENLKLFCESENRYIIPLSAHLTEYKNATASLDFAESFSHETNENTVLVEYKVIDNDDDSRTIVYRDTVRNALQCANYRKQIEYGKAGYTEEKYKEQKEYFGVIVLRTNKSDSTPAEIYKLYSKRWRIENFYDYFKNVFDATELGMSDYYVLQGLAFIFLISGLVHSSFRDKVKELKRPESMYEILQSARFIKVHKDRDEWTTQNVKKARAELVTQFGVKLYDVIS